MELEEKKNVTVCRLVVHSHNIKFCNKLKKKKKRKTKIIFKKFSAILIPRTVTDLLKTGSCSTFAEEKKERF